MEKTNASLTLTDKFFSIWGFGDIPLGKKIWWSMVTWILLLINLYIGAAILLFLVVLYRNRGEGELKAFVEIQGWIIGGIALFVLTVLFLAAF